MAQTCHYITILSLVLLGNHSNPTARVIQCTSTEIQRDTHCVIGYNDSVCLVCPIFTSQSGLSWQYVNASRHLFRDGSAVYAQERDILEINKCHHANYSLKVWPNSASYRRAYSCSQRNILLKEFEVRREVSVEMFLLHNQTEPPAELMTEEGRNISLQCVVVHGLPPINFTWTVNDQEEYKQDFNTSTTSRLQNFSSSFSFITIASETSVSCSAKGSFIKDNTVSIKLSVKRKAWLPLFSDLNRIILIASILSIMLVVMVATFCHKRKKSRRSSGRRALPPQPPAEVRRAVQSFFEDRDEETELSEFQTRRVQTMHLLTSSGKMKRWTARLKGEPSSRISCIVVTLHEESEAKDWCEFRMFVAYVKLIPKHKHIASILGTKTDEIPYQFFQEYVSNGTLKDFLVNHYNQLYSKSMQGKTMDPDLSSTTLTQVLKICISVIEALIFLGKFDLVHPGICAKKVLMDDRMTCKVYDCQHRYIMEREMSQFLNKDTAPLAWLAPETLNRNQYHLKSDVWSAGVFLWEILSLGKSPYENMSLERIKVAVQTTPPLPEPVFSCEETYLLMKECWNLEESTRPTLDLLLEDLQYIINDVELNEKEPYEYML